MIHIFDFMSAADQDAILRGTGAYIDDALAAMTVATESLTHQPELRLPAGTMRMASTMHITRKMRITGEGGGEGAAPGTQLFFDANVPGILVEGAGTILDGLSLIGAGTSLVHGIQLKRRATIRQCFVNKFGGNGIHIHADTNADPLLNANCWQIEVTSVFSSGGHGLFLDGGDANAGLALHFNAKGNKGWGVYDSSFLGNTYVGCHTSSNVMGAYKTDNPNANSVLVGCYAEGGQAVELTPKTVVIGKPIGGGGGQYMGTGMFTPFSVKSKTTRRLDYRLGMFDGSGLDVVAEGDDSHGWTIGGWDEGTKTVMLRHARLGVRTPLRLTTKLTTFTDEAGLPVGGGRVMLEEVLVRPTGGGTVLKPVKFMDLVRKNEEQSVQIAALEARLAALEAVP